MPQPSAIVRLLTMSIAVCDGAANSHQPLDTVQATSGPECRAERRGVVLRGA